MAIRSRTRGVDRAVSLPLPWGLPASLLLHAVLILSLLALRPPPRPPDLAEKAVEVEIVEALPAETAMPARPAPSPPPAIASAPQDRPPPPAASAPPEPAASPPPAGPQLVRPTRMLSAAALADPRSRAARQMLPRHAPDERIEQLCGIEAMAQVAAWNGAFHPDRLIAYAMGEATRAGDLLHAAGAAFHSGKAWYRISFDCRLTADHARVAGFAFAVGPPVPRAEWSRHNLPIEAGPLD